MRVKKLILTPFVALLILCGCIARSHATCVDGAEKLNHSAYEASVMRDFKLAFKRRAFRNSGATLVSNVVKCCTT
jgi:hypothetical protein